MKKKKYITDIFSCGRYADRYFVQGLLGRNA